MEVAKCKELIWFKSSLTSEPFCMRSVSARWPVITCERSKSSKTVEDWKMPLILCVRMCVCLCVCRHAHIHSGLLITSQTTSERHVSSGCDLSYMTISFLSLKCPLLIFINIVITCLGLSQSSSYPKTYLPPPPLALLTWLVTLPLIKNQHWWQLLLWS